MLRRILSLLGLFLLTSAPVAVAQDGMLYEVSESVKFEPASVFRSSTATLGGKVRAGTEICPTSLGVKECSVTIHATGHADDTTGIGPVSGTFEVLVQDWNTADAPEVPILRGTLVGTIDLSPAFIKRIPLGHISGQFGGQGLTATPLANVKAGGSFTGTFRLPFWNGGVASYLLDDGSIVPVQAYEYALGDATVRLELNLVSATNGR